MCYTGESNRIIGSDTEFRDLFFHPDFSLKQADSPVIHSQGISKAFIAQCLKFQVNKAAVSKIQLMINSEVGKNQQACLNNFWEFLYSASQPTWNTKGQFLYNVYFVPGVAHGNSHILT